MKTTLLLIFALAFVSLQAQETFHLTWEVGVNGEAASFTIESGDTIIWTWGDELPHSVVSNDPNAPGDFGSNILTGMGSTYEYTFTEEGQFDYNCGVHEQAMFGTITIEALSVEDKFVKNLGLYPNPAQDFLTLTSLIPLQSYIIVDLQGKQIAQAQISGNLVDVNITSLKSGFYFITVQSDNQSSATIKFIKR